MSTESEIVNRVEKSGLITIDLGEYSAKDIVELDISPWLWEGLILREKEFREAVKNWNWEQYRDKNVAVFCSTDAIVPDWSYMLIASRLEDIAVEYFQGEKESLSKIIFNKNIEKINTEEFLDKRVLVKGCGDENVPSSAYMQIVKVLQPVVKSLMFGEACSSVPVYKKPK